MENTSLQMNFFLLGIIYYDVHVIWKDLLRIQYKEKIQMWQRWKLHVFDSTFEIT